MDIRAIQAYAWFALTIFVVVMLYGYILHLYRSEKKGTRDYEKYGKLALDDEITSKPIEENPSHKTKNEE